MPVLFAFFDIRPLIFLFGLVLVPLFALGFKSLPSPSIRWRSAWPLGFATYLFLFWLIFVAFVGVERSRTFPMKWRMGEPGFQGSHQAHVYLEFRDFPSDHVGIFSDELARYLRGLGTDTVDVTFEVTTDWGHTRAFRETRIGDLTDWESEGGYAGSGSSNGQKSSDQQSPWN